MKKINCFYLFSITFICLITLLVGTTFPYQGVDLLNNLNINLLTKQHKEIYTKTHQRFNHTIKTLSSIDESIIELKKTLYTTTLTLGYIEDSINSMTQLIQTHILEGKTSIEEFLESYKDDNKYPIKKITISTNHISQKIKQPITNLQTQIKILPQQAKTPQPKTIEKTRQTKKTRKFLKVTTKKQFKQRFSFKKTKSSKHRWIFKKLHNDSLFTTNDTDKQSSLYKKYQTINRSMATIFKPDTPSTQYQNIN